MRILRLLVVTTLVVAGCATNPATGRRQLILMSEAEEIQLGRQADQQVRQEMGVYDDAALQQYVNSVGQRLAQSSHRPDLPWTFTVVDQQAVNAFALPGGFIYLTRGILPYLRDESELAAVLGHEVAHVDARHSVEAYSRQQLAGGGLLLASVLSPETEALQGLAGLGLGLLFLGNSRGAELESDQLGVDYVAANGWAPSGMPGLLSTLARLDQANGTTRGVPNWALTHPPAADRVERVQAAVAAAESPSATTVNQDALERQIDGVVYGDSREQGMVRDDRFVHPILRFAWTFPAGWDVINQADQVVAQPASQDANVAMVLQLAPDASGSVEQTARQTMGDAGYQQVDGGTTTINGLQAYVGTFQRTTQAGQQTVVRAAYIRAGDQTYVLAGVATPQQFNAANDTFARSIGTFRTLSAQEADRIQPSRIDFHTVRSGESWSSIASGPADGIIDASALAIMNGRSPDQGPRAGERIRIVVAG
jgi:predicted Zn-dependent protease